MLLTNRPTIGSIESPPGTMLVFFKRKRYFMSGSKILLLYF